jgi:urease accessory protein UreE
MGYNRAPTVRLKNALPQSRRNKRRLRCKTKGGQRKAITLLEKRQDSGKTLESRAQV